MIPAPGCGLSTLATCVLAAGLATWSAHAPAQEREVQLIKIAYLYNFLKFVRWPPGGAEMRICIARDPEFARDAQIALHGKQVAALPVRVLAISDPARHEGCWLLYTPQANAAGGAHVLTVGEGRAFVEAGGMIAFTIENNRVRFFINLRAVREAGLSPDAQLLTVALEVLQ